MFDFADVVENISTKMIDRHPHIFGDESRDKSAEQQIRDWEAIKAKERAAKSEQGVLDGVALPAGADLGAQACEPRRARGFRLARPRRCAEKDRRGKP